MWHRIAAHVLHCTVEEAQERMSSAAFTDMVAYYRAEPFGFEVDNFRYGTQTASIVNTIMATIPKEKGVPRPKPVQASDYYPDTNKKKAIPLTLQQKAHIERKKRMKRAAAVKKPKEQ